MNRKSCKKQLNNEKGRQIKGKTTKSSTTFRINKPNSPIVQMNVTNLITMNYAIFTSLTKVKNKPNSNPINANYGQNKANSNPIKAKTNPKQTQFQTLTCKNGPSRASTVEVIGLECKIDDYGKIYKRQKM